MTNREKLMAGAAGLAIVCLLVAIVMCEKARTDRIRAEATIQAQRTVISASQAAVKRRDGELLNALRQVDALKASTHTPAEIIRALPKVIELPEPVLPTVTPAAPDALPMPQQPGPGKLWIEPTPTTTSQAVLPARASPGAIIPGQDLKPLFDRLADCKAEDLRLETCLADSADRRTELTATRKQRDAAVRAMKGGNFWQRIGRAAKWTMVGIAIGAIAERSIR